MEKADEHYYHLREDFAEVWKKRGDIK